MNIKSLLSSPDTYTPTHILLDGLKAICLQSSRHIGPTVKDNDLNYETSNLYLLDFCYITKIKNKSRYL